MGSIPWGESRLLNEEPLAPSTPPHCFNPCCSGFASSTWPTTPWDSKRYSCFNPCCSGFASSTLPVRLELYGQILFQSVLFWIRLLNPVSVPVFGLKILVFQSVLFWIRLLNHCSPRSATSSRNMFQSVLFWIRL